MNPTAAVASTPRVSQPRRDAVEKARREWIAKLIDLSQRNNLLYYRPLKVGSLDLSSAGAEALDALLTGKSVPLHKLVPEADRVQTAAQVIAIKRKARENADEHGLETLFLAAGFASWEAETGKRPPEAAVLMIPIAIDNRNAAVPSLKRAGEPQVNEVLLHVLSSAFAVNVEADILLKAADTDPSREDDPIDMAALFAKLTELCAAIPQFTVQRRMMLGNFSFQKMAMVRDLRDCGEQLAGNDIIAGLAGDRETGAAIRGTGAEPNPREFDGIPPENEFLVLDSDSSQQKAICWAQSGQSLVIQGPPGTGKSQVIVNLIVSAAAEGKRILFVAEKRAALQVVLERLTRTGLGHLALDLHGGDTSRKVIAGRMGDALERISRITAAPTAQIFQPFVARRTRLNEHAERMHDPKAPGQMSVFDLQGRVLNSASAAIALKTRFRGDVLMRLTPGVVAEAKDVLAEAAVLGDLFLRIDPTPWATATFTDGHAVQAAIDLVEDLVDPTWPAVKVSLTSVFVAVRPALPEHLNDAGVLLKLLDEVNQFLAGYSGDFFAQDLNAIQLALRPASFGVIGRAWASLFNTKYRQAKATMTAGAANPLTPPGMLKKVEQGLDLAARWKGAAFTSPTPIAIPAAAKVLVEVEACRQKFIALGQFLNRDDLCRLPFARVDELIVALKGSETLARKMPALRRIEAKLNDFGLATLMNELRQSRPPGETWPAGFEQAWRRSCLENAWAEDPGLAAFNGRVHHQHVAEFRSLDVDRLELAARQVAARHANQAKKILAELNTQAALIRHEAAKKSRHVPFRKLMDQAPDVLAALFPCVMCSPLSVSQLLPGDRKLFDLVIFDEASQVLPQDAATSLMRGAQAVVAGDDHQLPPTQFFADGGAEDGDDDGNEGANGNGSVTGFRSLLNMMTAFLPAPMLTWHYRSRDERLIAFSNRHIYDNRLITFPGPGGEDAPIEHVLVQDVKSIGPTDSDSAEVLRIVEMVVGHARREIEKPPEQRHSLGVITLGIAHAHRVEAAVDKAVQSQKDVAPFFDPNLPERFFVKSLERVQGDERDVIVLTLGVAPDAAGRVSLTRFGPLNNREQGYRRLNVAITRARYKMILVSSFTPDAINVSASLSRGMELLRLYLQYAQTGGRLTDERGRTEAESNIFEADIAAALAGRGIVTVPQWGASGYRIDLVAQHPTRPGRLVLAIECDGATYHSAATARDRDRLRQQHLEALGWKFHRIWSTDWFARRNEEIERVVAAYQTAVIDADRQDEATRKPLTAVAINESEASSDPKCEPLEVQTIPAPTAPVPITAVPPLPRA